MVKPGSGAANAGIEGIVRGRRGYYLGDIITAIDGKPVRTSRDIYRILDNHSIGDEVTVTIRRGRKTGDVTVKLTQAR